MKAKKMSSITLLMKGMLKKNFDVKYEDAKKAVGKMSAAFDRRHFSWYKSAFKRGALKGTR